MVAALATSECNSIKLIKVFESGVWGRGGGAVRPSRAAESKGQQNEYFISKNYFQHFTDFKLLCGI